MPLSANQAAYYMGFEQGAANPTRTIQLPENMPMYSSLAACFTAGHTEGSMVADTANTPLYAWCYFIVNRNQHEERLGYACPGYVMGCGDLTTIKHTPEYQRCMAEYVKRA